MVGSQVFGLVHHAHAAAAQLFNDPVVRYGLANHARMLGAEAEQVNDL